MEDRAKERAQRIIENYAAKLKVGRGSGRRDGDLLGQAERYAAGVEHVRRLRAETAHILDARGIPAIMRPFYNNFTLKLDRLVRECWSEHALADEGRILVMTWTARGLRREVLIAIARDVLKLDLAVPGSRTDVEPRKHALSDRGRSGQEHETNGCRR